MKGVLSMKTNMQEINEPAFHAYLKKAQSSPNTIRSCLAAYRLYHSLYNDLAVNHLPVSYTHLDVNKRQARYWCIHDFFRSYRMG